MRIIVVLLVALLGLSACGNSKFQSYHGPEVTRVLVFKEQRKMYLMHGSTALKQYDVGLGFAPLGHKVKEGDGRTPEGEYTIDRRNPNSKFHLSIGISYPNTEDREYAARNGFSPGGDIFIHGKPSLYKDAGVDWTAGCIAVSNREIQEIYAMVKDGTPISIYK